MCFDPTVLSSRHKVKNYYVANRKHTFHVRLFLYFNLFSRGKFLHFFHLNYFSN